MQFREPAAANACVGREAELARLAELYTEAQTHGERLVLLEGRSGVGKSRILSEFRARVRLHGGVVLEGRCEPGVAFGPFTDIAPRALRFLEEVGRAPTIDLADLECRGGCHRLWYQHGKDGSDRDSAPEPGTAPDVDALERRLRFFDAIAGLLRDVAAVRGPVVMFHDLERADRGTLQLVELLLESSGAFRDGMAEGRALRALFVASVRSDVARAHDPAIASLRRHPTTTAIEVGHLDADGVRAFLQSPELVARVLEKTGGIPEAIELLLESDPLTPEERLERRLDALGTGGRALVEALAVVGHPSDLDLLASVAGSAREASARHAFGDSDLVTKVVSEGRLLFSFARAADRERVVALIAPARQRALHARCAQVFAAIPGREEDAARHALSAGDLERAVPLAIEAARTLAARHAHDEAAALLERVLEAAPVALPIEVHEHLSDLYRFGGDYRRALAHAESVRRRAPESPAAARRVGELQMLAGQLDDAAATLEAAHRLADASGDPSARADALALLGELHYQRGSYDHADAWAERALAEAESLGELVMEIRARNTLGKVALARKEAAAAAALFETNRAKAAVAGLGHQQAQALTNLGVAMLHRQELARAEEAFSEAIDVATRASDTRDRAIATENLAVLAHLQRDYARALGFYHEAVALLKRLGNRAMLARVANNLGELYLSLGDRTRARALCEFAAHVGGTGLPPSVAAEGLLLRGRVEAADANHDTARASFEASRSIFERVGESRIVDPMLELARLALADGDISAARSVLAAMPVQESPKRVAEVALVAVDLERAAGGDTLRAARRAVELAERADDDELLLPALVRLARAQCDAADPITASRTLERAQNIEARLTDRVPKEAIETWSARPARAELAAIEATLTSAARRRDSSIPPKAPVTGRISVIPDGRSSESARELRIQRWRRAYPQIVGSSQAVHAVLAMLDKVAPTDALVLVRGESGTGKELIAEALHNNSRRRDRPFVKVNCAALVETLLLSELFGHERGAFTGASARKKGRFELADGGTIFLDEIGDISPKTQVALLRVLQEREFERVGGTQPIKVDVRIIAATNRDLEKMVREGAFREDLYYRLRGVMMELPPLRERAGDLPELCEGLLRRIADERGERSKGISTSALELLATHRWPGNVRELENVLRSATLFADGDVLEPLDFAPFAETFASGDPVPETSVGAPGEEAGTGPVQRIEETIYARIKEGEHSLFEMKKALERECIVRALGETGGNITQAAALLGMKRPRLSQLVKQYGLQAAAGEG